VIRSTFLVAPDGKIAKAWKGVKVDGHADAVLAALQSPKSEATGASGAKSAKAGKKTAKAGKKTAKAGKKTAKAGKKTAKKASKKK
jgi:peroxiredoxin Q/BCP